MAINSVKFNLRQVIGTQVLTYKELDTMYVRVEGILNSRPVIQASMDTNNLSVLTPGPLWTAAHYSARRKPHRDSNKTPYSLATPLTTAPLFLETWST